MTRVFTPFLFYIYTYLYVYFYSNHSLVDALESPPRCIKCKWFVPDKLGVEDHGLCKMHKNTYSLRKNMEVSIYEYAKHCRDNQNMCGKEGYLYEEVNENENENMNENMNNNMNYSYGTYVKDEDIRKTLKRIEKFNKRRYYSDI